MFALTKRKTSYCLCVVTETGINKSSIMTRNTVDPKQTCELSAGKTVCPCASCVDDK